MLRFNVANKVNFAISDVNGCFADGALDEPFVLVRDVVDRGRTGIRIGGREGGRSTESGVGFWEDSV